MTDTNLAVRKYNPTTKTYAVIASATKTYPTIGGIAATQVSFSVTDSGELNTDGSANETIVDPSGLGSALMSSNGNSSSLANTGQNTLFYSLAAIGLIAGGLTALRIRPVQKAFDKS